MQPNPAVWCSEFSFAAQETKLGTPVLPQSPLGEFSHLGLPIDDMWWAAGELLLGTALFRRINLNKLRTS